MENVKVNVDSDITKAVDKVQDAVVSVINLQSQNQSSGFGGLFGQQEESSSSDDSNLEAYSEGSGVIYKRREYCLCSHKQSRSRWTARFGSHDERRYEGKS